MFLRKSRLEPLPVTMSAVRMGERVLQIGVDDPELATAIAAKVGLSGSAALVITDEKEAARVSGAAAGAGVLVDVRVGPLTPLPFDDGAFDLLVVHGVHGQVSGLDAQTRVLTMREWHRVVRTGGRVMVLESTDARGLRALLKKPQGNETYAAAGGTVGALETAGFRPVRILAEREGYRFVEGHRT